MTPKELADDLIWHYLLELNKHDIYDINVAKTLALMAVDRIITFLERGRFDHMFIAYWLEVKIEIEVR